MPRECRQHSVDRDGRSASSHIDMSIQRRAHVYKTAGRGRSKPGSSGSSGATGPKTRDRLPDGA